MYAVILPRWRAIIGCQRLDPSRRMLSSARSRAQRESKGGKILRSIVGEMSLVSDDAPLSSGEWIALAYERLLLLRTRDYAGLQPGKALRVVPIDYAIFNRDDEVAYEGGPPMDAARFFGPWVDVVVPTGSAHVSSTAGRAPVPLSQLTERWRAPQGALVMLDYYDMGLGGIGGDDSLAGAFASGSVLSWIADAGLPNFWLSAGNGDGWTRYMRWEDVLTMPPIYLHPHNDDDSSAEVQEREQEIEAALARDVKRGGGGGSGRR
jgi:hypothetical protein